jgi:hypothetical protein
VAFFGTVQNLQRNVQLFRSFPDVSSGSAGTDVSDLQNIPGHSKHKVTKLSKETVVGFARANIVSRLMRKSLDRTAVDAVTVLSTEQGGSSSTRKIFL